MFEILPQSHGKRFHVKVRGRLTDDDYKELTPRLDGAIAAHGPIRLLIDMEDFNGMDALAVWDDFVFGIRHWNDFERVALIGDRGWQKLAAKAMDPLTKGEFRFFELGAGTDARKWIDAD